jgi:hypothetical protein
MELNLTEIGQTLAVGGVVIIGIGIWLRVLFRKNRLPFRLMTDESPYRFAASVIAIACILGTGILVEDVSKSIVGQPPPKLLKSMALLHYFLPTDEDLRVEAIFERVETDQGARWKPRRLSHEMAERGVFSRYGGNEGAVVEEKIRANDPSPFDGSQVKKVTSAVYYQAKNVLYQQDKYFTELRKIESRVDFARSLCFSCLLLLVAGSLLAVVRIPEPLLYKLQAWGLKTANRFRRSREEWVEELMSARHDYEQAIKVIGNCKSEIAKIDRNLPKGCLRARKQRRQNDKSIAELENLKRVAESRKKKFSKDKAALRAKFREGRCAAMVQWALDATSPTDCWPSGQEVRQVIMVAVILILGADLSSIAFASEQFNYNVRVFGYFSSLHDRSWGGPFGPTSLPSIKGAGASAVGMSTHPAANITTRPAGMPATTQGFGTTGMRQLGKNLGRLP